QIFADNRQRHGASGIDLLFLRAPTREIAQRSLGRELVITGKPALDRQVADERLDRAFHARNINSQFAFRNSQFSPLTAVFRAPARSARHPSVPASARDD